MPGASQYCSESVTARDENRVAQNQRTGPGGGRPEFAEWKLEQNATVYWIDRNYFQPRREYDVSLSVNGRCDGRGITGSLVRCRPQCLPCLSIKRDDSGVLAAASDIEQQFVTFDNRTAREAEIAFGWFSARCSLTAEIGVGVALPDLFSISQLDAG